ncbi:MAG: hypothetical protein IJI46_10340 [Erysipelotrichaceae bacterium]|nr:hypothetical protein [Erysipelotrichaceae bacterium]
MPLSIRGTSGIVKHYDGVTILIVFEGKAMITMAEEQHGYYASLNKTYIIKNGEKDYAHIAQGDIGDYVQDEIKNNEEVKAKLKTPNSILIRNL